jgi:hypothetical protein
MQEESLREEGRENDAWKKEKMDQFENEAIHGVLFLFEYYWSYEIMQDEEEVGYVAGMREVHTSCGGESARK